MLVAGIQQIDSVIFFQIIFHYQLLQDIDIIPCTVQFNSVQSFSRVQIFVTPWTTACQASLSIRNSWNLYKLISTESMMPFNHLLLCCPLLLLPSIIPNISSVQFSHSVMSNSLQPHEQQHTKPLLSITNSRSSLRLMSIESVLTSRLLILCRPLLLLPPIPPSIRVFSNESTLCMRWPKYWSFSLSIIPSK